jgi:hypothetical protein
MLEVPLQITAGIKQIRQRTVAGQLVPLLFRAAVPQRLECRDHALGSADCRDQRLKAGGECIHLSRCGGRRDRSRLDHYTPCAAVVNPMVWRLLRTCHNDALQQEAPAEARASGGDTSEDCNLQTQGGPGKPGT